MRPYIIYDEQVSPGCYLAIINTIFLFILENSRYLSGVSSYFSDISNLIPDYSIPSEKMRNFFSVGSD